MLKSYATQLAATVLFGPIGLVYSSMAAAVFLTLLAAVLYFSEIGVLALLIVWPLAIIGGLIFVKFNNDQIRQSGSRLLLSPGEERLVSALGSWLRAVSVVALLAIAGYIAYLYLPQIQMASSPIGRIVDSVDTQTGSPQIAENDGDTAANVESAEQQSSAGSEDSYTVVTLPSRDVVSVVVNDDLPREETLIGRPTLTVNEAVVNVRDGPGTNFSIVVQIERGDRVVEFARDGEWVNVETENSGYSGWVYGSLLSAAQ